MKKIKKRSHPNESNQQTQNNTKKTRSLNLSPKSTSCFIPETRQNYKVDLDTFLVNFEEIKESYQFTESSDLFLDFNEEDLNELNNSSKFGFLENEEEIEMKNKFEENLFDLFLIPPLLPKQSKKFKDKMTLVLDLDQTLVYSCYDQPNSYDFKFLFPLQKTKKPNNTETQENDNDNDNDDDNDNDKRNVKEKENEKKIVIEKDNEKKEKEEKEKNHNEQQLIYVQKRPHLKHFLERCSQLFEVVVFTAGTKEYADIILDELDPNNELISHRLYRDSCKQVESYTHVKDLTLLGRDIDRILIIDDLPSSYFLQPQNAIPIQKFCGNFQCSSFYDNNVQQTSDNEFPRILEILEKFNNTKSSQLLQGIFVLTSTTMISCLNKKKKKFVFTINIPNQKTYCISAKTEKERSEWVYFLENEISSRVVDKVSRDDFNLLAIIGRGTYGKVYMVKKKDTSEMFAMKILQKDMLTKNQQISQRMSERNVLMRFRHPFIIGLQYSFQTPEKLYMVLDYAPGGELFSHLKKNGKFSKDRTRLYVAEIILGLEHLHKMDIIYRGLKPENLLIDEGGHVKIADFSYVRTDLRKKSGGKTNTFSEKPEYLSPEIILNKEYTEVVDWWSLGILIYEMLVGMPPFYAEELDDLYMLILRSQIKVPSSVKTAARDLILKLLDRNPTTRLGSNGSSDIKKHPFFSGINWEKVYNKEYTPDFVPQISNGTLSTEPDEEFTEEHAFGSLVKTKTVEEVDKAKFKEFVFIDNPEGNGTSKK
ncbi:non-specific serine/threonine protein kinase [Anaeramoeba flamelloides]|uniref:non-specific serine/threonine protein kinase n=1 Tax=Anaeramoeba flamelloides TaxID=1746091 RepID=A0AAV8AFI0_9EUKA|nr:non-specific serine/threonine protein kinase [Anaeramoeba flamelloides]